jgi:hypothetical protein
MTQLVLSVDISPAVPPLFTRSISLTTWDVNNKKRFVIKKKNAWECFQSDSGHIF